jgi:hypothetical protein
MIAPGSWRGIVNRYRKSPPEVQEYFKHLPKLLEEFPLDVAIAYLFARIELVQNTALYCGVVKLHRGHTEVTRNAINAHHMERKDFEQLFENVFGKKLTSDILSPLKDAERIRDKVLHGKHISETDKRTAIVRVIEFAELFNKFVQDVAGFKPFADLRGFKGRGAALDKSTTRWIMKGLGFKIQ